MKKPNILFLCTVNRMRSATAERVYANDERFCPCWRPRQQEAAE